MRRKYLKWLLGSVASLGLMEQQDAFELHATGNDFLKITRWKQSNLKIWVYIAFSLVEVYSCRICIWPKSHLTVSFFKWNVKYYNPILKQVGLTHSASVAPSGLRLWPSQRQPASVSCPCPQGLKPGMTLRHPCVASLLPLQPSPGPWISSLKSPWKYKQLLHN